MSFETPGDNIKCDHCDAPGVPYEYMGLQFSGLYSNRGEKLCSRCLRFAVDKVRVEWSGLGPFMCWKGGHVYASTQTRKALGIPKGMSMEEFRKTQKKGNK